MMECEECGGEAKFENGGCYCISCGLETGEIEIAENTPAKELLRSRSFSRLPKNLRNLNKWGISNDLFAKLNRLLYQADISEETRAIIKEHIINDNVSSLAGVLHSFIKCVHKYNYPLTNTELRQIARTTNVSKKVLKSLSYQPRDYSWYISKIITKFDFIPSEDVHPLFCLVKREYERIRKVNQGIDLTKLIRSLCYLRIRGAYKEIDKRKYKRALFNVSHETVKKYREMIK